MRIGIFIASLHGGGAEKSSIELANAFCKRGHDITIVTAVSGGPCRSQVSDGVTLTELGASRVVFSIRRLCSFLRNAELDVLITVMTHCNIAGVVGVKLSGVSTKLIVTERATYSQFMKSKFGLKNLIIHSLVKPCYSLADSIVAVSGGVKKDLVSVFSLDPNHIRVIYNGMDLERIERLASEEISVDLSAFSHVILGVGRLSIEKGFDSLIRSFSQIKKLPRFSRACLIILGSGPLEVSLRNLAKSEGVFDAVIFLGYVENPYRYMRIADVFVLSSTTEGLPNVLVQALVCGCKVVSTDCPSGPREILSGGRFGNLVFDNRPEFLVEGMINAIDSPRQNVPKSHLLKFSDSNAFDSYTELLSEIFSK